MKDSDTDRSSRGSGRRRPAAAVKVRDNKWLMKRHRTYE